MAKKAAAEPDEAPKQKGLSEFTNAEGQIVVYCTAADGSVHYAWRKDGARPEVPLPDFTINKNAALIPLGTANFASSVRPA